MEHLEDVKRVTLTIPQRSVSPRLNQLLKLFQSKVQEHTPNELSKKERTTLPSERKARDENEETGASKMSHCRNYPSYNSSLKKCLLLNTKLSSISCSNDKPGQAMYSHSRTPYTRDTTSRKCTLSRQKSFHKNSDMNVIREEQCYKQEEGTREQLKSVNFLLKGSSRSTIEESKDQGYSAGTSIKSLDNERNHQLEFKDYSLKRSEPSLDAIITAKLTLSEEDNCRRENDKQMNKPSEISDSLNREHEGALNLINYKDNHRFNDPKKRDKGIQMIEETGKKERNVVPDNSVKKFMTINCKTERPSNEVFKEESDGYSDSFRVRSLTDSTLKNKKRKPLTRSRSVVIFKPPRRLCVSETDEGIQMDESSFLQIMNDIKSMKTCLLKLKRELQEAPVLSPLSTLSSGSQLFFDDSFFISSCTSPNKVGDRVFSPVPGKLVRRTTVDSCTLRNITRDSSDLERGRVFHRYSSCEESKQISCLRENCKGEFPSSEKLQAMFYSKESQRNEATQQDVKDNERENEQLKKELADIKTELEQVKQERNCHMIVREELEHELDSKNYTIKLLQTQLEGQESRNEVQSFRKQVKALEAQVEEQKDKIFNLVHDLKLSAVQTSNNLRSKRYWSELRVKLKDAVVINRTATPHRTVIHLPSQTTSTDHVSQADISTMKKSEVE